MVPTLWYHDRRHRGDALPVPVCELLARLGNGAALTDADRDAYRALMDALDMRHLWLACGCHGPEPDGQAILFPRRSPGRLVHLVHKGIKPHASDCPFARLTARADLRARDDNAGSIETPWDGDWLALPERGQGPRRPGRGPSRGTARAGVLEHKLWTLLDAAGYASLELAELKVGSVLVADPKAHYAKMHRLDARELASGVAWSDVSVTYLPELPRRLAHPKAWSEALGPARPLHGYFLGVVDTIEARLAGGVLTRAIKGKAAVTVPVARPVTGAVGSGHEGPYWVLADIVAAPGPGTALELAAAHALPALSRGCLLALGAQHERVVVAHAIEQARFWKAQGIRAPIHIKVRRRAGGSVIEIHLGDLGAIAIATGPATAVDGAYAAVFDSPSDNHLTEWRRATTAAAWKLLKKRGHARGAHTDD